MESAHWARVKEIFTQALDQSPDNRDRFVHGVCGSDKALLQDVLKLMEGHTRASGTLSQPLFPLTLSEIAEQPPRFSPSMVVARRFRIVRLIARGGMGDIYEAEDLELRVRVALKTIRPDIAQDERVLELFKNEIQAARRVTHPNVCRIYDLAQHVEPATGKADGEATLFLTMELLAGVTLSEHLKTHGPFSLEEALPLIRQLALALQAAHEAGVIHRDFKPCNVILTPTAGGWMHVTVTDFGLAVVRAQSQVQPLPGAAGGTPAYMAPEQVRGGEVTTATDVYAFALVIAEMVGARVQPARASRLQTILRPSSAASSVILRLPPAFRHWEPVLLSCLECDPAKRDSRPMAVAEALIAGRRGLGGWSRPRTLATAAGLIVLLGLTALVAQRYSEWNSTNPVTFRKLGPDDDNVSLWRPSPDGRHFAVTDWSTGNLGLRDISTGEIRLLTKEAKSPKERHVSSAAFSPDGNRIAYTWFFPNGGSELHIIDRFSGEDALLVRDPALTLCEVEDWSPDGERILARFTWRDSSQLAVISVRDRSVVFPRPKGRYGNMVFAPDGAHVVFSGPRSSEDVESDIFEVPIYGGPVTTLINDPANDQVLGFSRDGRRLIFSSDRKGTYGVWAVAFSGDAGQGEPVELAHDLGRASPIGLAQDGKLYYTIATNSVDVYTAEIDVTTGRLLSAPNNVVKRFRGSFRFPTWSQDGSRLSLISSLDSGPQIWIYSRESHEIRTIEPRLAAFNRPQWDPSGDRIFVTGSDRTGRSGIFRVDVQSGDAEMAIDQGTLNGMEGAWARDGRTLFDRFGDPRGAKAGLFRIDIQTGQRLILYRPPADSDLGLENLALSPDESTLAFQLRQQASGASLLMLIPTAGGVARQLLQIMKPESFLFGSFAWTADSKQILAVRTRNNTSELWLVPVDGGTPRKVEFPSIRIVQLRMSPDGRTIAFVSGEASGEVWVAENLLP